MISLLFAGQYAVFVLVLLAIIFSLTFHEFGHAMAAKLLGDDTAERMGRLTLNPVAHIDPVGLLMVLAIGFGYAKPVPCDTRRLRYPWGGALVAAAGPLMNLLLAIIAANVFSWLAQNGMMTEIRSQFLFIMVIINLLLMLFNLIPLGALDGHYIMPWLLPKHLAGRYEEFNMKYGNQIFLVLIVLSIAGVPIFSALQNMAGAIIPFITFI